MSTSSFLGFKKFLTPLRLRVLFVATEAAPFAKAGGLGDVMYSLPLALNDLGVDARVMIPRYGTIDPKKYNLETEFEHIKVPTDQPGPYPYLVCNIKKYTGKKAPFTYFLENMEYYEKRANVYGYADDHVRWALLCRGTIEFIKKSQWKPDIIVASDWQTGLISNYIKTKYANDSLLSKIGLVFAIHNLHYQGMCDFRFMPESERDSGREPIPDFFNPRLAKLNWMLRGIMYSDYIVTVSPTYAKEIVTKEYGEGLENILKERRHRLLGILNGISYKDYNPETSPHIPVHYNFRTIQKKKRNKFHLQRRFGLEEKPEVFLMGMVSRLTEQKGFDLLGEIIDYLFENLNLQLVVVGDGESRYKEMLQKAGEKFPKRVGYSFAFEKSLPHLVFAGADALLMPSKFEPCGIVQLQAMRYGCVPIVRKTGGLADTVIDFAPQDQKGTGFVFEKYDPISLYTAIVRAYTVFSMENIWTRLAVRAMQEDFSWHKSAKEYLKLFRTLLREKRGE